MFNFFERWSFQKKLMVVVAGLSASALLQMFVMTRNSTAHLLDSKKEIIEATAESWIDKVDRNLFERYGDVQAFALSEPARSGMPDRIHAFMNDMMGAYSPIYDLMIVVNARGRVIAANQVGKDGKPIGTQRLLGKDFSQEEWFKHTISGEVKAGTAFVEDLHQDEDVATFAGTSGRVMNFSAPIVDKASGTILGVWTNRMSWTDVVDSITQQELKSLTDFQGAGLAYLIDSNGRYLMHPEGDKMVLKSSAPDFEAIKKIIGAEKRPLVDLVEQHHESFNGEGLRAVVLSKGFTSYPGKGWYAVMEIPSKDEQNVASTREIIFAGFIQFILAFLAWTVARSLSRRFGGLNDTLRKEAADVRKASDEIGDASKSIAEASTQQAAALQETAAAIEEISTMIKKSADNSVRSSEVSGKSQEVVQRGKESVERVIVAIEEINQANGAIMDQVEDSNRQITDIVKVITEIGTKTKVINDIVFQTKLLSFNASVEAARAGEHGKGFAVVAEEVGNLAQMSGNAAKEIADMLNGSIQKVEGIVSSTKSKVQTLIAEGKQKVEAGTVVAKECGVILEEVVQNVQEVGQMVDEITVASKEQSTGVSEIAKAVNQLDQATQSNAGTSKKAAHSAQLLNSKSQELFEVIRELDGIITGNHGATVTTQSAPAVRVGTAAPSTPSNVVPIKSAQRAKDLETPAPAHRVVKVAAVAGGAPEVNLPAEDDPRFKEF